MRVRLSILVSALCSLLMLCSCADKAADDGPITMFVVHNPGSGYFTALKENVKRDLDIDLEFVYECSSDASDQISLHIQHNDLPADIVFTNFKARDEYLKGCCVDFMSWSHLTGLYPFNTVKSCTADDGGVYALPMGSRLIGITYNATLMEEMGWKVPHTFADMLSLKRKCDAAGIEFAVTDLFLTGGAFNFLFHLMGSQWLSTIEGTQWMEGFLDGSTDIEPFKRESEYFRKWLDAGLFGFLNISEQSVQGVYSRKRALFMFSITNSASGYDGPCYDKSGQPTGQTRHDEYKVIPWISEDGTNNCFTLNDNFWAMLNSSLLAPGKEDRRTKALRVLEYMLSDDMLDLQASTAKDIYISAINFDITEDRLYADFKDKINGGFLQPWYYNYFDSSTIVNTGTELSSYMINSWPGADAVEHKMYYTLNPEADFDTSFEVLADNNNNNKQQHFSGDVIGTVGAAFDREQTARLAALAGALALQEQISLSGSGEDSVLASNGDSAAVSGQGSAMASAGGLVHSAAGAGEIQVALMPYARDLSELEPWKTVAVQNSNLYPGELLKSQAYVLVPVNCNNAKCIRMTGAEIKSIVRDGFAPSDNGRRYRYVCIVKSDGTDVAPSASGGRKGASGKATGTGAALDEMALDDNAEYLVAVPRSALEGDVYASFEQSGKVLPDLDGLLLRGLEIYFSSHPDALPGQIGW